MSILLQNALALHGHVAQYIVSKLDVVQFAPYHLPTFGICVPSNRYLLTRWRTWFLFLAFTMPGTMFVRKNSNTNVSSRTSW
jgi:hypothetical protein